jgi:hypothetical protein
MGVSMMFKDAQQAYTMDEEYRQEKKNGATNFGAKHDDTKAFQIESAVATAKKSKEYRPSLIDGLPDSVKAQIVVKLLKKAGSLQLDKELEGAKMECAMDKLAKRTNTRRGNQLAILTDLQES